MVLNRCFSKVTQAAGGRSVEDGGKSSQNGGRDLGLLQRPSQETVHSKPHSLAQDKTHVSRGAPQNSSGSWNSEGLSRLGRILIQDVHLTFGHILRILCKLIDC